MNYQPTQRQSSMMDSSATPAASSSSSSISSADGGNATTGGSPLTGLIYNALPSSLQYALYDFWEANDHNEELNKYVLFNGGPWIILLIVGAYLYFVLKIGPRMMKNRPAYDLKQWIRLYNLGMVSFNAYLLYQLGHHIQYGLNCWGCNEALKPVDPDLARELFPQVMLGLLSRFFDFIDTVFFILRKKFNHVSFLHVFHHTSVPLIYWIGIKFAFLPIGSFIPYLNFLVHVIMYTYYGLSTFKSLTQRLIWLKKFVTHIQILQFLIALVHSLQPFYLYQCKFPLVLVILGPTFSLIFLSLFISFYIKRYIRTKKQSVD